LAEREIVVNRKFKKEYHVVHVPTTPVPIFTGLQILGRGVEFAKGKSPFLSLAKRTRK